MWKMIGHASVSEWLQVIVLFDKDSSVCTRSLDSGSMYVCISLISNGGGRRIWESINVNQVSKGSPHRWGTYSGNQPQSTRTCLLILFVIQTFYFLHSKAWPGEPLNLSTYQSTHESLNDHLALLSAAPVIYLDTRPRHMNRWMNWTDHDVFLKGWDAIELTFFCPPLSVACRKLPSTEMKWACNYLGTVQHAHSLHLSSFLSRFYLNVSYWQRYSCATVLRYIRHAMYIQHSAPDEYLISQHRVFTQRHLGIFPWWHLMVQNNPPDIAPLVNRS